MEHDEENLYAEMRAAIRGDRERAERRAQEKHTEPAPAPPPTPPQADPEPIRVGGIRRLLGRRR